MALIGKTNEEKIWNYFMQKNKIGNPYGVAGLMGNIKKESNFNPMNMQNSFEDKLKFTDETYVAAVDNNTYHNFQTDRCGFGLVQITIPDRKTNMWIRSKETGKSIGDLEFQLDFIMWEFANGYNAVWNKLKTATSVKEASDYVCTQYERPADQSAKGLERRSDAGEEIYAKFVKEEPTVTKKLTIDEFIEQTATYLKKYAPKYNIKCYSAIIAQGILESGRAESELAVQANNFFGLKYKPGRCPSALSEPYYKVGSEQNADGSYVSSAMQWFQFKDLEQCVIGYLDFINTSRYSSLKGVADPKTYLELIKAAGYATSIKYVDNVYRVVESYDLTKYDEKVEEKHTTSNGANSSLVTYTKISPNKTSPRNHEIDTITIHVYVGQVDAERGCNGKKFVTYNPVGGSSCNYVVGYDGSVGLCVEEKDRSWCSSNKKNDHRAITIEVASETKPPYAVTDKALDTLIKLCADICKRNNIKKLVWSTNKKERVNHVNGCNMTVHRDYAAKSCPGEYLYNRHSYIADEVNKILGSYDSSIATPPSLPVNNVFKIASDKKLIQTYLNTHYGDAIKSELGELLAIDGSIGAKSKKAITIAIQTELNKLGAGLEVDGSFGSRTTAAYTKYVGTLKKGNKNNIFITLWQCTLVGLNYNPNGIDGSFGNGCKDATVKFQQENKLSATGALNANTFKKALK